MIFWKILGAAGIALIAMGITLKNRRTQDILFILGGVLLEIYSISIKDVIFIILQIVFIFTAVYDLAKMSLNKV